MGKLCWNFKLSSFPPCCCLHPVNWKFILPLNTTALGFYLQSPGCKSPKNHWISEQSSHKSQAAAQGSFPSRTYLQAKSVLECWSFSSNNPCWLNGQIILGEVSPVALLETSMKSRKIEVWTFFPYGILLENDSTDSGSVGIREVLALIHRSWLNQWIDGVIPSTSTHVEGPKHEL